MPINKSNAEHISNWFRACPAVRADKRFRIDYLAETPIEYAIYASPTTMRYHENILGEEVPDDIQNLNFIFAAKEPYGADIKQNSANLAFFEEVAGWVMEQNASRNLPTINEGMVKSIVPTLTAFPAAIGIDAAKYQIQLKITYRRA